MRSTSAIGVAGILLSAGILGLGMYLGDKPAMQPAPVETAAPAAIPDRAAIEQIVRDYLIDNPEVMVEVQAALETRQQERQREIQTTTIGTQRDAIFHSAFDGSRGNLEGNATVVEFFDYNCGYCKRHYPDLMALMKDDPNLRVVFKEFPILGPDSQKAHIVSMAFRNIAPEKWAAFHDALMTSPGRADEATAIRVATSLGVEEGALREAMKNGDIVGAINGTYQLAEKLAITGTPSYVIGNEVMFGAVGREALSEKVAAARAACGESKNC